MTLDQINTWRERAGVRSPIARENDSNSTFCEPCGCRITAGRCEHGTMPPTPEPEPEYEHPIFGKVIHSYSRAQAIEDGVLVDVSETAREAGITFPVALTRAVFEDCVEWTQSDSDRKSAGQSVRGRLWDVISMLRFAIAIKAGRGGDRLHYQISRIPRPGHGRKRLVTLKSICGSGDTAEPVITVLMVGED